jgi:hypothetical protein
MDDNEAVEDTLGIMESIKELWNRAKPNDALTTSQKLEAVSPEQAKAYRMQKEIRDAVAEIKRLELEELDRVTKNDPWKFLRNVAKYIVGEIDKR